MNISNRDLKRRIIEISYKHKLSHLGSCLTAVDIIKEIYDVKKQDERFVLSSGHAGLALYVVLEKYLKLDAEKIFNHHGVHPDYCEECHIDCSSGSLGNGLPIAVGMALADRSKVCYTLISDGECSEGSIWEALRIANEQKLNNLKIYLNFNHWGAYKEIPYYPINDEEFPYIDLKIKETNFDDFPFLIGQSAHYITLSEENFKLCQEILKEDS